MSSVIVVGAVGTRRGDNNKIATIRESVFGMEGRRIRASLLK